MKKFILSVAIVLGMTLLSHAQDGLSGLGGLDGMQPMKPLFNWNTESKPYNSGFKSYYYKGKYQGLSIRLNKYQSIVTPKGSTHTIMCTHAGPIVSCY